MRIKFEKMTISPDFPGYTHQDIQEQTRKMFVYLDQGLNPFTGMPYGSWETNRYILRDVNRVKLEMLKYWNGY